mmetsp:Transcript_27751/g.54476  ORF Transcript_27751/g.54476 Transcript_27751/m.54476 type:complete len:214 (+) Transcript_27751:235-876(+)
MPSQKASSTFRDADGEPATADTIPKIRSASNTGSESPMRTLAAVPGSTPRSSMKLTRICEQSNGKHGTKRLKSSIARLLVSIATQTTEKKSFSRIMPSSESVTLPELASAMRPIHRSIIGRCVTGPQAETKICSLGPSAPNPISAIPPNGQSKMWSGVQPQRRAANTCPNSCVKTVKNRKGPLTNTARTIPRTPLPASAAPTPSSTATSGNST